MSNDDLADLTGIGHNSRSQVLSIVERVERLAAERQTYSDDIRSVYAEAKANGLNPKTIRAVIRIRKQDRREYEAAETELETYLHACGML